MDAIDRLQQRWLRLQSQDIGKNSQDLALLALELAELQKFVVYLAAKAALGQPLTPEDPVLASFLKVGKKDDARRALLELVGHLAHQHAPRLVQCPACGAGVRDVHGVTDERCTFCGATVRTQD
jgi:hypothetical protein